MNKYRILITETLQKVVEVEADNFADAYDLVREKYEDEEIVLDSSDFIDYSIEDYTDVLEESYADLFYKVGEDIE